jgi:hypothetical protein
MATMDALSAKQLEYLELRKNTKTDVAAARQMSITRQIVTNWKRKPEFLAAYEQVVGKKKEALLDVQKADRRKINAAQVEALVAALPEVVQEHINIALTADRIADRMRAIDKFYEILGFGAEATMPVSRQNQIFIQIMNLMGPQVEAEAARRGLPSGSSLQDIVEGEFAEMEDEDADSEDT